MFIERLLIHREEAFDPKIIHSPFMIESVCSPIQNEEYDKAFAILSLRANFPIEHALNTYEQYKNMLDSENPLTFQFGDDKFYKIINVELPEAALGSLILSLKVPTEDLQIFFPKAEVSTLESAILSAN